MKKPARDPVNNLIVVSDLHAICRLGLFPVDVRLRLDSGGTYEASRLQRIVWGWWREFWDKWVPVATRGEPYSVAINGDAVDGGAHHGNTTHISANPEDQERLAMLILKPVRERCVRFYMVRGTEIHGGQSGCSEESIARQLEAVPDKDGHFSRYRLRLRVGRGLVDIAHHIGTTGSMAYETSAIQKELEQIYAGAARWGDEPPDVVVRSHRHTHAETRVHITKRIGGRTVQGIATSCTTPGWQLRTPFAWKVPGGRRSRPQFGGVLVRCGDEDVYTRAYVRSIEEVDIENA